MTNLPLFHNKNISNQSDFYGVLASAICLIHCIATPFLFIAHTEMHHHEHHHVFTPLWWKSIDIIFLLISLLAVYWSAKTTSKRWVKYMLYISWFFLTFLIIIEKLESAHLPEALIYFPAFSLILLHMYNLKYCQCTKEECCAVQ